jgi:hypothetical protein
MNENVKKQLEELITGVGAITELWTMVYKNLRDQGLTVTEAAINTKSIVETIFAIGGINLGGK